MEVKAAHYSPNGTIIKLIIDDNQFFVQIFNKEDNLESEISTSDYKYARKLFRDASYNY